MSMRGFLPLLPSIRLLLLPRAWQAVVAVVGRGRLLPRTTKLLTKLLQLRQPLPHCSGSSGPCLPTFQWLESDQCCHHCSASFGRGLFLAVPSPPFEVQPKFAPEIFKKFEN